MIKKAGPPVPPRPNAVLVANALAKSRGGNSPAPAGYMFRSSSSDQQQQHHHHLPMGGLGNSSAGVTNTILIGSHAGVDNNNSWQKSQKRNSLEDNNSHEKDLQPLQIETYTKSPSMMRSKRIVVEQCGGVADDGNRNVALADDFPGTRKNRPVPLARGKAPAQDLISRPKNIISLEKQQQQQQQNDSIAVVTTTNSSGDGRTVVVTTLSHGGGSGQSESTKNFATTAAAGVNNNKKDEDHHNFLDYHHQPSVRALRDRGSTSHYVTTHQSNYVNDSPVVAAVRNECTIGQESNSSTTTAKTTMTIGTDNKITMSHHPAQVLLNNRSSPSVSSSSYSSTTAIELLNNRASTENNSDVIVVGSTTSNVLVDPPSSSSSEVGNQNLKKSNCNRIEIKATDQGTAAQRQNGNWQMMHQTNTNQNHSARTTLLIRSGSSASSDSCSSSSISSTSSSTSATAAFNASVTATTPTTTASSKSMARQQQQPKQCTEILINHSSGSSIANKTDRVQYPTVSEMASSLAGVTRPEPEGGEAEEVSVCPTSENRRADVQKSTPAGAAVATVAGNGQEHLDKLPKERKVAFHEKLISELAAMHIRGQSPAASMMRSATGNETAPPPDELNGHSPAETDEECKRRRSIESPDRLSASPNGSQGSHRSRIRTADWIEVGDNGKQVVFSSCQISLEDSGLEDEMERLEETSSSGAGDSWDSVIDHNER